MNRKTLRCAHCLAIALALSVLAGASEAKEYLLFYLGGQSNMNGFGKVAELPSELNGPVEGVRIFHGNATPDGANANGDGLWAELRPGHGRGFVSDGEACFYSDYFGLELTFGRRIRDLLPDAHIALIKYSNGGTSLDAEVARHSGCWDPDFEGGEGKGKGINQYDHFLATLRQAMAVDDIDGDGERDQLVPAGILWMQGESDAASSVEVANRYETNLRRLIGHFRAALRHDDLPVVIGLISDSGRDEVDGMVWDHGGIVRAAQAEFVKRDRHAALVTSTDGYGNSDPYHYDSAGYIDLGVQFAKAIRKLR